MNQFRLDLDAKRCAEAHQDAHCGKMLLELVQQLCTAFVEPRTSRGDCTPAHAMTGLWPNWSNSTPTERLNLDLLPYAHTHRNHPCAVWTRATRANFDNTIELAQALAVEFRHRFGKPHGSEAALNWVKRHRSEAQVPDGLLTPYALAMPEEYTVFAKRTDARAPFLQTIYAYRAYYRAEKHGHWRKSRDPAKPSTWVPAKWTRRDPPEWF